MDHAELITAINRLAEAIEKNTEAVKGPAPKPRRRRNPILGEERQYILNLLYENKGNRHKVARETGRSLGSISEIAKDM